ncbi:hypothetical protein BDEG_20563 [Batrachochytrium dendrobatidis JEL423]|uniref:Anaphase-promoting complex subunit 4 WD40 domain-containing protein n=1 Tax=Batrachochytrium dendrobatidis (strain JEL423) TaxID=403673 RepID=A0A177W8J6_BATDL|nr:hypothetical protein BDEG_20563 [Batrachochytrium dendrobatidis JEL423]
MCVQYNPFRREIYTGGEDSVIKVWESESGKLLTSWIKHLGWITNLLYCKEVKVLFSCSIDGSIIAWGPNGKVLQRIQTGTPIYCLAYNARRQQLMAGQHKKVRLFQLLSSDDNHGTTDILERRNVVCLEHTDVVSCIVSCEGRFYSAGYDRKIIIYDVPHHGDLKLRVSSTIKEAHDAAISCMIFGKDADNSWLITGSFDRVVKLWSLDGNLMQRFDGFSDTITSLCYVVPTQTLWVTANSSIPVVYDPRSGINVSDFVRTDDERFHPTGGTFSFKHLVFIPETNEAIGISTRRSLVIWKYNSVAPLTVLPGHADIVECLTFTSKEPLLIFSGGDDGVIRKWERLQLNTFMYSQELLMLPKDEFINALDMNAEEKDESNKKRSYSLHHKSFFKRSSRRKGFEKKRVTRALLDKRHAAPSSAPPYHKMQTIESEAYDLQSKSTSSNKRGSLATVSAGSESFSSKPKSVRPGIVSLLYYEELDVLVSGYEDSRICIWGYNEETIKFTPESTDRDAADATVIGSNQLGSDSVSNRVAGMALKFTLLNHRDSVTGLVCFFLDAKHWMISTGWDRRICIWDLQSAKLHDVFRNSQYQSINSAREELAADGIILSLDYSHEKNTIGYASSDKLAYIRKFSPNGSEMTLVCVLQGHEAEVTQIKWHRKEKQWITGSEDRTLRIWTADGIPCLRVINNDGPITALCIDAINGCLITGSQDKVIRVFDIDKKDEIVQKNIGHSDEIRSLIHIPVRNQYVSASWDNTVRIWNAYLKKGQRRIAAKANMTFYTAVEEEEIQPTFSEMNPLIVPKLLSKPIFAKDFVLEKLPAKDEEYVNSSDKTVIEDELRQTFNDLDIALNADQKLGHGGQKGLGKPRIQRVLPKRKPSEIVSK